MHRVSTSFMEVTEVKSIAHTCAVRGENIAKHLALTERFPKNLPNL
jgi:hypothetical protein